MSRSIRHALPLAAAVLLAAASLAQAKTVSFWGTFGAEGQSMSMGKGKVTGTVDTKTDMVHYTIVYSGLTGPVQAAHFHGPAKADQSAGVLLPISGPYKSGMTATVHADAKTVKDILAGMTYVNLHTKKYPDGEIRAQVMVKSAGSY